MGTGDEGGSWSISRVLEKVHKNRIKCYVYNSCGNFESFAYHCHNTPFCHRVFQDPLHSGNVQFNFLLLDSLNTQYLKGSEVFNLKKKIYLTILTVIPKPILI